MILATRHGATIADADSDPDLALLLDLDLSILAAERATYAAYAEAIRREYAIVPDIIYRPGRRRVLAEFLARPRIYATPHLFDAWEAAARANLVWESADGGELSDVPDRHSRKQDHQCSSTSPSRRPTPGSPASW